MAMFRTEPFTSPLVRISYAMGLFKPRENDKGVERYGVTLIVPKDAVGALRDAVAQVVTGEWGDKGVERFKKGLIKNPILAGDGKEAHDKDGSLRPGLGADVFFIRPTSNDPVKCFDQNVLPMDAKDVVSGHWGRAVLNAYAWHHDSNGDGVSFGINMWQHVKEDESLGGGSRDPGDFFQKEGVATGDNSSVKGGAAGIFG